ncbi:hypothetical protein ACFPES_15735 [Paenibacillus sp. GCM10023248]|uniref:hypothetical protein n=1 Tax=Bacillales TaxID=1385 RepID=UPI002379FA63|nr:MULTISPECIES: hypothetical protein [Bacillales]MDD9268489.1 hypothetical protein [Paenibacillus sp. MAHUQ-63]MDR6879382.1 hypothetical protein [Bacillus sp. 3255]
MKKLQYDNELDNAIFFSNYVAVLKDGRMVGGGMIEAYNETEVKVGDRQYSRKKSTFVEAPAPEAYILF